MKKIALFPGSFDPFTKGHADIVERGSKLFDEVVIGIGENIKKKRFFSVDLMLDKINSYYKNNTKIRAVKYTGLTAKFAQEVNANFLLRGLRNTTDFEFENSVAQANRHVFDQLETVFIITSPNLAFISSSVVRELYNYNQNINSFLPFDL